MTHAHNPTRFLLTVGASLFVLLALSVVAARIGSGVAATVISLVIAAVKAAIVATFFMDLRRSPTACRLAAGAGLMWLMVLITLTLGDYLSRPDRPNQTKQAIVSPSDR